MKQKRQAFPMNKTAYQQYLTDKDPKRPIVANCLKAFLVGGFICFLGQCIMTFYMYVFDFTEEAAGNPTIATLIIATMFVTGFGFYDRIGQFAGAGTAVPITGFANAVISSAIEHRAEGFILGVGTNMLKLAGPVIVYGVFSAFVIVLIRTFIEQLFGLSF